MRLFHTVVTVELGPKNDISYSYSLTYFGGLRAFLLFFVIALQHF